MLLWAPADLFLTVFTGVPCRYLPISVDRFGPHFLIDPVGDERRATEAIRQLGAVVWVSLNAYHPTWPIEERVRAAVQPLATWGFGDRPEVLRAGPGVGITPMREQYLRVIGAPAPATRAERRPAVDRTAMRAANRFLHRVASGRPVIALHADTAPEKEWSVHRWREIARRLTNRLGACVVAVGMPPDELRHPPVVVAPADWHIHVAIVRCAAGFVGVDSCFAHVADAFGLPGLVLFGPTCAEEWGPAGPALRALRAPERNLGRLPADAVWRALDLPGLSASMP